MKSIILYTLFCLISATAWANPCQTDDDCPGSNNMCDQGQCTIAGTGGCTTNDDCPGSDNTCDQGTCWCHGPDCGQGSARTWVNVKAWLKQAARPVSQTALTSAPDHFSFAFETTQGEIQFDCPQGWSPLGEQRLYELVTDGFFTNTAFFRVLTGFVAQFGISGDPAVSAKWENATIADDPVVGSNVAGTLTFADAGPNTRTTQVFINLADNTNLDSAGFSPVCKISNAAGLAVAQKLYAGYGEGAPDGKGPDQDLITSQGNAYLKANFPLLDYVQSAVLK